MTKIAEGRGIRESFAANGLLAASEADLYTCPVMCQVKITTLICLNTHATNTNTVKLYLQPSGGTSRNFVEEDLLPKDRLTGDGEPLELNEGDKLRGEATNANEVTWSLSGRKEYSV